MKSPQQQQWIADVLQTFTAADQIVSAGVHRQRQVKVMLPDFSIALRPGVKVNAVQRGASVQRGGEPAITGRGIEHRAEFPVAEMFEDGLFAGGLHRRINPSAARGRRQKFQWRMRFSFIRWLDSSRWRPKGKRTFSAQKTLANAEGFRIMRARYVLRQFETLRRLLPPQILMNHPESKSIPPLAARFALFRWLFLLRKVFLTRSSRRYWSQYGEEIGLDRVLDVSRPGFFVDVGCYHPTKYSNTFKLYRRGWRGVNIDLDEIKIAAFNLRRPGDTNIVAAVSDKEETATLGSTGFYTVTQTTDAAAIENCGSVACRLN